jgi:thioredoxin reductase
MQKTSITEPAREIDVIHKTDVLVVSSGPGGLAAALAAALSLKSNEELDRIDIARVQAELARQGVRHG